MEWIKQGNFFNTCHAQVPVVDIHHDGFWRIYFSKRENRGPSKPYFIDVEAGNPAHVLRESKTPILEPGQKGLFDWAGVMPTEILQVGDLKYLYYIGWSNRIDVPYHNNVGLAISKDNGETWEKFSDGPIFATSHREPGYIGTISIIKKDNTYFGYYLSCRSWQEFKGKMEPIYDIKIATSENLIDWLPLNQTAIGLEHNEGGISKASVLKIDETYYLWYAIRNATDYRSNVDNSYRIKCATSSDLIRWSKIDTLGIDIDPTSTWEKTMVEYPHVISVEDKTYLFYNGDGFGETGIGYALLSR